MNKLLIMFLLYSSICLGQQGINYKAIISDNGAVVQNQQVGISFTILESGTTAIYKELHVLNTDSNGLVITNIGEGITTIGDFATLDWSQEYFLNVEVDTGNGTVDMGTTAFKNVPYALHAKTATTITGPLPNAGNLEKITEDNKTGYRLANANPIFYGNIGTDAVDLSIPEGESTSAGATGNRSFVSGLKTTASGYGSTAIGSYGIASGDHSSAIGFLTDASGAYSTAMGLTTTAESWAQLTVGIANTTVASVAPDSFVPTERLFVIGNGTTYLNRSDAMIVLKSGDTEINGQLTIDPSNDDSGYTLPSTKGDSGQFLAMNNSDSGTHWKSAGSLVKITEGSKTKGAYSGYRLVDADPINYGDIGEDAVDLSIQLIGSSTAGATGKYAFASGRGNTASGTGAVAMGSGSEATGVYSVAIGLGNTASREASVAIGIGNVASGGQSSVFGLFNIANSNDQMSIGRYCTEGDSGDNRLFVIGNGADTDQRHDAMVVDFDGNTTINGKLTVDEVQGKDSGNADMKAYVYGLITGSSGAIKTASSDGFTVTRNSKGSYSVIFNNVPSSYEDYMVVSSIHGSIGFVQTIRNTSNIAVTTYNRLGALVDMDFNFVVYKK